MIHRKRRRERGEHSGAGQAGSIFKSVSLYTVCVEVCHFMLLLFLKTLRPKRTHKLGTTNVQYGTIPYCGTVYTYGRKPLCCAAAALLTKRLGAMSSGAMVNDLKLGKRQSY